MYMIYILNRAEIYLFILKYFSLRQISCFSEPKPTKNMIFFFHLKKKNSGEIMKLILLSFEQRPRMCPYPQWERGGACLWVCMHLCVPQVLLPIVSPGRQSATDPSSIAHLCMCLSLSVYLNSLHVQYVYLFMCVYTPMHECFWESVWQMTQYDSSKAPTLNHLHIYNRRLNDL